MLDATRKVYQKLVIDVGRSERENDKMSDEKGNTLPSDIIVGGVEVIVTCSGERSKLIVWHS